METAVYEIPVSGMTCRPCEDTILEAVLAAPGVLRAEVSYWKSAVRITYDPALTSAEALGDLLIGIGYAPCRQAHGGLPTEILTAIAALAAAFLLPILPLPSIPQVQRGASLLFLLLVGLITGTHCICMCGGILLSQTAANDLQGRKRPVPHAFMRYQAGRLLISLLLGLIFGAAGQALTFSSRLKSMIYTLCGMAVLLIGLCSWGIFPALRRFQRHVALCRLQRQRAAGRRFHAGLVSGHAAGNGDLFNSGKDASRQSAAHISALYSGGNAGGRNRHGDQGHREDKVIIQHDGHMEFRFRNGMKYKSK